MGPNKHALDNYVRYKQHMSKYSLSFMSPHVDLWDQQYRVRQLWILKSICLILEHICWISLWVAINTHVLFGLTQVWWTSEIVTRGWTLIWMYIYGYIYRERERDNWWRLCISVEKTKGRISVEINCWDYLLRLSVEMICWGYPLWSAVEIICWDQLLRLSVKIICWDDLLWSAVEITCCVICYDKLLRLD